MSAHAQDDPAISTEDALRMVKEGHRLTCAPGWHFRVHDTQTGRERVVSWRTNKQRSRLWTAALINSARP